MKFLFSLIFTVLLAFTMSAQNRAELMSGSGDTLTNTGTVNLALRVTAGYQTATFQIVNTKVSGTVAGSSIFQGSNDGVNWVNLDTFVNANVATNVKFFEASPPKYLWYRVSYTGTGTMVAIPRGYAVLRRY
jgi:hypothetical protein